MNTLFIVQCISHTSQVWPGETLFPDYTNQACVDWWVDEISRFHKEVKHDALWIVSNLQR